MAIAKGIYAISGFVYITVSVFFCRMLMSKKNLVLIYEHLFKEGVMVAEKNFHAPKHPELDVPNLQVIKTLTVRTPQK